MLMSVVIMRQLYAPCTGGRYPRIALEVTGSGAGPVAPRLLTRFAMAKPQTQSEPTPPFPKQKLDKPGIEAELEPRPKYQAPRYKPAEKLLGKVALVTGGDSGIGRAVAVLYAREGADVAITALPAEKVDSDETRRAIEAEGRRCIVIEGDLTEADACIQAVERTVAELGQLDILVHNAGYQNRKESLEDVSDEEWDRTFRTNIYAYYRLVKAALPHLGPGSAIIATGSETGIQGASKLFDYSATKGAIHAFTKTLAQDLLERGIRVNCVAPGPVWTPLNPADTGASPDKVASFGSQTPMKRPAQPEEIAPAYVFFASDADSSYITGVVLPAMGGQTVGG
jgi:NAD(P)-dependent dehydrogenase (short-subunit alcohol dehydrogenase family)